MDRIAVDGAEIARPSAGAAAWVLLNKPPGVLTSARDERDRDRKTVFDILPQDLKSPGLTYVGRLDYMTEGALLLTTDGAAAHRLTHPSSGVARTYVVRVRGDGDGGAALLRRGVDLEDGHVRPESVTAHSVGSRSWDIELTLREGRTHEVRRVCEAVGLEVEGLKRTRFGPISLGDLAPGAARRLTRREVEAISGPTAGEAR